MADVIFKKAPDAFGATIQEMVEESGQMWIGTSPKYSRSEEFNAVVITDTPERCFRILLKDAEANQWEVTEDQLDTDELAAFFGAFGSHWRVLFKSWLPYHGGSIHEIRAFIRNGRRLGKEWSISMREVVKAKAAGA